MRGVFVACYDREAQHLIEAGRGRVGGTQPQQREVRRRLRDERRGELPAHAPPAPRGQHVEMPQPPGSFIDGTALTCPPTTCQAPSLSRTHTRV